MNDYEDYYIYGGCFPRIAAILLIGVLISTLCGCKTTAPTIVERVRTELIHTTDTVERVDSFIDRQQTIIREVDSATMARYGIQLQQAEKAWLIQNEHLQREINKLREAKADTIITHDSIPVPYPVVQEVNRLYDWQKSLIWVGASALLALLLFAGFKIYKLFP